MRRFVLVALMVGLLCGMSYAQNLATLGESVSPNVVGNNNVTIRFSPTDVGLQITILFKDRDGNDILPTVYESVEMDGMNISNAGDLSLPFGLSYNGGTSMTFSIFLEGFMPGVGNEVLDFGLGLDIAEFLGDITYIAVGGYGMGPNDGTHLGDLSGGGTIIGGPVLSNMNIGGTFNSPPTFPSPMLDIVGGTNIGFESDFYGMFFGSGHWFNFGDFDGTEDMAFALGENIAGKKFYTQDDFSAVMLSQGELFTLLGALSIPAGWEFLEITIGGNAVSEVPEPATLFLLGCATAGIPMLRRRMK